MISRSFRRSGLGTAVGMASLLLAAACGSDAAPAAPATGAAGTATSSATGVPIGIAEPPAPEQWTTTTDPATGVSFALPGQAKLENRPGNAEGTTPNIRLYHVDVTGTGTLGLGVSFLEADTADYSATGLEFVHRTRVEQLKSAGAVNLEEASRQPTTIAGRPALDSQLGYTDHNGMRNIWFTRIIGEGTRAVQLQSIAFADPPNEAATTAIVEKYHQQLVATVRLP